MEQLDRDKVVEDKLYRVVRKKANHVNTKVNPCGTKAAIQFNKNNGLDGPVELLEVPEEELVRTEYVETEPQPRPFGQIIVEDVIVPVLSETLYQGVMIGTGKLIDKIKASVPTVKAYASAIVDGLSGKETKACRLLREQAENTEYIPAKAADSEIVTDTSASNNGEAPKFVLGEDDLAKIIAMMRESAVKLAVGISMLNNCVVEDDGNNPEKRLEVQTRLAELNTEAIKRQIDLLLSAGNREWLDTASIGVLESFRNGKIGVGEHIVPVSMYLES